MWRFLLTPSPRIYIHLARIPTSEIPLNPQAFTQTWLHSRFQQKDLMLSRYFQNSAPALAELESESNPDVLRSGVLSKLPLSETLPSAFFLTSATIILLSTRKGRLVYLSSVVGGSILTVLYSKFMF